VPTPSVYRLAGTMDGIAIWPEWLSNGVPQRSNGPSFCLKIVIIIAYNRLRNPPNWLLTKYLPFEKLDRQKVVRRFLGDPGGRVV